MYTVYYANWSENLDLAVFEGSLTACKVYILAPDGFTVVK